MFRRSRQAIGSGCLACVCAAVIVTAVGWARGAQEGATILSTKVICKEAGKYIGWPTVARTREGELLAVFSGDRAGHVCPWGKVQMVRSADGGETWTEPEIVCNTPLDDRDAGILETREGTLVVSWFTSLAFDRLLRDGGGHLDAATRESSGAACG